MVTPGINVTHSGQSLINVGGWIGAVLHIRLAESGRVHVGMKKRLQTEVLPREARLFVQIFVWLELADTKLEMVGAEINESGAVFTKRYVFSTFLVE